MELALLYSGGKDSSLAALLLDTSYDVTLVTAHFGATKDWTHARGAVAELGYASETLEFGREVMAAATARMVKDGYPRGGIQHVHEHVLEAVYGLDFDAVVDDTHRGDRIPSISRAQAQSLEDRHDVDYLSSLSGSGRGAIDRLIESHLDMEIGPSKKTPKADYEGELRHPIAAEHGQAVVDEVFPDHVQSYVHGRR